jgi:hypothetical protein
MSELEQLGPGPKYRKEAAYGHHDNLPVVAGISVSNKYFTSAICSSWAAVDTLRR